TVTAATGGSAISADTTGGSYTTLTGPVLAESAKGQIKSNGNPSSITLTAPTGFEFDSSSPATVTLTGNADATKNINHLASGTVVSATTTASQITFIVKTQSSSSANTLTWGNVRVRPTTGTPLANGSIVLNSTGTMVGVTLPASAGTLTEVIGAASQVKVETAANGSGSVVPVQSISSGSTLTVYGVTRDQFGNYVGNPSATAWSLTNKIGGVVDGDLTGSPGASVVMHGNSAGSAVIHAANASLIAGDSGTITVLKLDQTITITTHAPASAIYGSTFPVAATASSGLLVDMTTTGGCSISDGTITMTSGTNACVVHYNQAGNGFYNAAVEVTETATAIAKELTGSITAGSKVYDGTDAATILTRDLNGVINGDDVTISGGVATFNNKNFGGGKPVSATGLALGGPDAGKYNYDGTAATTADITKKDLVVSATGIHKVYDGNTGAAATLTTDALGGDDVTPSDTASFEDKNVGAGKPVHVTGISISGVDAGNYILTNTSADTIADITPREITVSAVTNTKIYDGTTSAAGTPIIASGTLGAGDTQNFTETYDDKNVSTGKTLTPSGVVNDGNGGANYNVTFENDTTGAIEMLALALTADSQSKVYGTNDPALTYQITGGALAAGDSFSGSLTRAAGEDVGAYAIGQGTLSAGGNYNITFVGADLIITAADITVTADTQSKIYGDADPALTYQVTSGTVATGDHFAGELARVAGENVGTYAINQGTLTLNSNYNLTYAGADLTISKATPVITWSNPADITYPAALSATDLHAATSVSGTLTYNPILGTILSAGPHQLAVDFVPADTTNYNDASTTVLINVVKGTPAIIWANPADIAAGTALGGAQLNATEASSVPGSFVYNPASGTVLTTAGAHTLHVDFTPTDTANYNNADRDVTVNVIPTEIVALQLTASPTNLAFDQTSEITVTGKDQYGNVVTNNSTTVAVLAADGGGSLADTLLTLNAGVALTHLSKDSAGAVHVTVSSGVLSPAQTTVTFTQTDTSSPFVESHTPVNNAAGVLLSVHPTLMFSEALNATTINSTNIQLRKASDDSAIPATVSIAEGVRQVIITPTDLLDFGTDYYFAVSAHVTDMAGNPALVLDSATKNDHKFTTVTDTTVLAVTQISALHTFATADNTFDNGWKWTFHITVPTIETQLQMKFADWTGTTDSIGAADNIRYYSAQSSNAADASGAITVTAPNTYAGALDLTQDMDASQSGRQVEVSVEARVPATAAGGSYSTSYGVQSN
ncbi:MAG: Ig-like domain-containing protein, partial [Candidatus Sungbacteria bacterium]|nr:Ig-like domain-containing protein [Candidatus Sungbacteria bacterium]